MHVSVLEPTLVQWDDIRLEPFCLHQIAALILQKDTYHVSELVVTSYLERKWGKDLSKEMGKRSFEGSDICNRCNRADKAV